MDNPEDLTYCSYCSKPICDGDSTQVSPRHDEVLHMECYLKLLRDGKVTVEADEYGDAYQKIDVTEEDNETGE